MIHERIRDKPKCIEEDYLQRYRFPYSIYREEEIKWHRGAGIVRKKHPLHHQLRMDGCGECQSENVLVIAAHFSVTTIGGKKYWDYEVCCQDCGKFTHRSYDERK